MTYDPTTTNNGNISQILGYYPKYSFLDSILSLCSKQTLNLYIDLKGCAQALYQEWAVKYIIEQSKGVRHVDISLFLAVLEFIAFHKIYTKKRNVNLNMFFFFESGASSYHTAIHPEYKANRHTGSFFGLDDATRDFFFKILDKNYHVIDKVCGKLPGISVTRLKFLEADFVPYYIMNRVLTKEQVDNSVHIIYSTDKDMLQCLDSDNKFQFYRHYKNIKMISRKDILNHFFKEEVNIDPQWFPLILAITGDSSDFFGGVDGVKEKTILKIMDQIIVLAGKSMDFVYDNLKNKKPIFDPTYYPRDNAIKRIIEKQDIVIRNLKLLSFKLMSDTVDEGFPTHLLDQRKVLIDSVNMTVKVPNASTLINALEKADLGTSVNENTIAKLF